jgi:hypothetical protein
MPNKIYFHMENTGYRILQDLEQKKGAGTQPEACKKAETCDEGLIISFLGLEQVLVSY